ncbi:unnamed protein product [Ectocarpus sp. 12 AP-2014]
MNNGAPTMASTTGSINVNLKRFDCRAAMSVKCNAVVIGKRNTGKSVVIAELLYYLNKQKVPRACVFSATEESNRFFCRHIPDSFIFDEKNVEGKLTEIVEQQKRLQLQKDIGEIDRDTDLRVVIVLDDMGYNRKALTSQILTFIFMNGRHYDITLIVAIQHVMQLTPALRSNTDYVICLKEGNKNVMRNLYENFFGVFEKPVHFKNAFDACTKDFGCLILNNTVTSVLVNDTVNWYKATPNRVFRFGSKEFWEYHDERYVSIQDRYLLQNRPAADTTMSSDGTFVIHKHV